MEIVINVIISLWFLTKSLLKSLFKKSKIAFKILKRKAEKTFQTLKIVLIALWVLAAFLIIEKESENEED